MILGADFHAHEQSQRAHLRILRSLPTRKKITLALEIFPLKAQKDLDLFMRGDLSEAAFLKKVKWDEVWGFPWKHYAPLLELARERGHRVLALNSFTGEKKSGSIRARERVAVSAVARELKQYPDSLVYVIFGDLHLARGLLPQALAALLKNKNGLLVIHQDSEKLYFRLARQKQEHTVSVLRRGKNQFCVMTSPPWVRWQNYLLFLEGQGESEEDLRMDPTEWLRHLLHVAAEDLGLKIPENDFEAFDLQSETLNDLLERHLNQKEIVMAHYLMTQNQSFFLPESKIFVLLSHNLNHASALCGDYLQCKLSKRTRPLWNFPKDFEAAIWIEALCFFTSKMNNHRRKPDRIEDLLTGGDQLKEVLLLVLSLKMRFLKWAQGPALLSSRESARFKPRRRSSYFHASRVLGGLLGERLFANYRSGVIRSKKVHEWMSFDVTSDDFHSFFEKVVRQLEVVPSWLEEQDVRL